MYKQLQRNSLKNGKTMKDTEKYLPLVKEKKTQGGIMKTKGQILRENVKYLRDIK